MKNAKPRIDEKIEQALHSLDGVERAEAPPYFFTRVQSAIEQSRLAGTGIWYRASVFLSKPLVAASCVIILILINFLVITTSALQKNPGISRSSNIQAREEFAMNVISVYETEIEP